MELDGGDEVEGFNEMLEVNDGARARELIGRVLARGDDVSLVFRAFARPDTLDLILAGGKRGEFAWSLAGMERSDMGDSCD